VLDADLQDPPAVVAKMIKEWEGGAEVVYGVRKNRKESLVLRGAFTIYYRLLKVIAHIDIPTDAGDFCLMDRKVLDQLNAMPERNRFIRGLRGWVGFKQVGLPYERPARAAGTTKYNVFRLFNLAMDGLTSFSAIPLRLSTWVGLLCSSVGFCLMVWAVFSRLVLGNVVSGWASLAVMLLFFSGVQLIMLGVIGEYLSRMFEEVKQRPLFVVESKGGWLDRSDSAQS
jgi:dolichol-phosphate mannosyltransferase